MAAQPPQPPQGSVPPQPGGQPPQQYYGQQPYYAPQSNGIGVAGGVVGIVSLVLAFIPFIDFVAIVGSIVAIILGAIGVQRANRLGGAGKGMAITGIVTGAVGIAITVLFIAVVYSIFATHGGMYNFTFPTPS